MHEIIESKDALIIGASITLNELQNTLKHYIKIKPGKLLFFNIKKRKKYIYLYICTYLI